MENLGPGVRIAERWFDRRRIDDDITKKSDIDARMSAPGGKAVVPAISLEQPLIDKNGHSSVLRRTATPSPLAVTAHSVAI
jgi:hypothetical protein